MRGNMWAGAGQGRREVHLWGEPMQSAPPLREAKRQLWNLVNNRYYVNSYRMTDDTLSGWIDDYTLSVERSE